MSKKGSAPEPPDPRQTARAALNTNVSTAKANAYMGNVNSKGPGGSVRTKQTGWETVTDPYTGQKIRVPTFTETTSLSNPQQKIFNRQNRASLGLVNTANDRMDSLAAPMPIPDDAARQRIETALYDRISPRLEEDRAAMETRLANQGLVPGSRAYTASQGDFDRNVADTRLAVTAAGGAEQQRAFDMMLAGRGQNMNEILSMLGRAQPTMPQKSTAQMPNIPTTDVAGLINAQYEAQAQAAQQKQSSMGGLFGSIIGAAGQLLPLLPAMSDVRLKTNISQIGVKDGLSVYQYRYLWDEPDTVRKGYMAQEVMDIYPDAVVEFGDYLGLDYSMLPEVE